MGFGPRDGLIPGGEGAFELKGLGVVENGCEGRARDHAKADKVAACEERWRNEGFRGGSEFVAFLDKELVVVEKAIGAEAVDAVELQFVFDVWAGEKTFEG